VPLPSLIEIVPLDKPVRAEITVPGSKSITNRALVLASLADGETTLQGALWSEDTQVMVECLQELGYMVNVTPDPDETCNRTITVYGLGGKVPRGGTAEQPLELFVGNAGTAARFLAAMVCLGEGVYRLHGVPRMHERPQAALFVALRQLGYRIDSPNDKLPALIHGTGPKSGAKCAVSIEESSQFASALLLGATVGKWSVGVVGENAEESPYVVMTSELVRVFPYRGGKFQIEPDASSGSYFWAAGWIASGGLWEPPKVSAENIRAASSTRHEGNAGEQWEAAIGRLFVNHTIVSVREWPKSRWQIDSRFIDFAVPDPRKIEMNFLEKLQMPRQVPMVSRSGDLGDSIMTLIAIAPLAERMTEIAIKFTELGRLRVQECERVVALRTELTKCGAKVVEEGDTLTVYPSQLHGAEIETYNDHRMAMCFAILGLKVPGIKIKNPACVKKTFPNFFQKLAAAPPHGLGATIRDASGRKLAHEELFAD
jgi:3-phosphoshikimate 1-carboxyvinyltransferase